MSKIVLLITGAAMISLSCVKAEEKFLNSSFQITESELLETINIMPENIQEIIKNNIKEFSDALFPVLEIIFDRDSYLFFPVNKSTYLPENYEPDDLIKLDDHGFTVNKKGMAIRKIMLEDLKEILSDAEKNGFKIMISSAYRSYSYQKNLYNYYVNIYGQEETDRFSARPGTSQHQLGTALDFGNLKKDYADTEEGSWLIENSWKYGFSLSYPENYEELTGYSYEPWHFRYTGKDGTFLEKYFFQGMQHYMLDYIEKNLSLFSEKYK